MVWGLGFMVWGLGFRVQGLGIQKYWPGYCELAIHLFPVTDGASNRLDG